jgi:hypothetical protein
MEATIRPFGYLFIDLKQNTGPFIHPIPGRFAPITCSPRVDSPRKVSRFAPLNRYYIIIDEVFFGNYLFISCIQKNKIKINDKQRS